MTSRESGFTILEALVAFAILAAVLAALYAVVGTALRSVASGDRLYRAAVLAQSKLDEVAAMRDPLPPATTGAFADSDIQWRIEAQDIGDRHTGQMRLQRVRLVLTWPGATQGETLAFETRHLGAQRP